MSKLETLYGFKIFIMKVYIINNVHLNEGEIERISSEVKSLLSDIDFAKFECQDYLISIYLNADNESLKFATKIGDANRYIVFQNLPKEFIYNNSFEAKLNTIRVRLQTSNLSEINNFNSVIFIVDFSQSHNPLSQPILNAKDYIMSKRTTTDGEEQRKISFVPRKPKYSLDKVIMTPAMKEQIDEALSIIKNQKIIYEDWGFSETEEQPKAILSFWGPPGTGKTMCAHGVAAEVGKQILEVNYAEIESKYAGESPKNLSAAFNAAQECNAVLFFDEADSFLGKRITDVQHGHDQAINSLRSQMLILLESFEGIVIFATNLVKNFDPAFQTRILRHIKFDLPNLEARIEIYKKLIPSKAPFEPSLSQADFEHISTISEGFSGRDIRNSILDAFSAAAKAEANFISLHYIEEAINKRQLSYKQLEEDKKQENKKIAADIKDVIIAQSNKQFNEALLSIAIYSAWANGTIEKEEEDLISECAKVLDVELHTGLEQEYLPPLSQVIDVFNTPNKKCRALDMSIRVICATGFVKQIEIDFIDMISEKLGFPKSTNLEINKYIESLVEVNKRWISIADLINPCFS